ncbi:hypothetical protein BH11BAC7_BH11BAC7_11590 [soil metagenome]
MSELDNFYLQKSEPVKSCLLALRSLILAQDKNITSAWKYGMPFFCYKGKMFCYLWVHKEHLQPYLGIVEGKRIDHPELIAEKRSRMKILLIDAAEDLPVKTIEIILQKAIELYRSGEIKTS